MNGFEPLVSQNEQPEAFLVSGVVAGELKPCPFCGEKANYITRDCSLCFVVV